MLQLPSLPISFPRPILNPENKNEIILIRDKKIHIYNIINQTYDQPKDSKKYHPFVNFCKNRYDIPIMYKDFLLALDGYGRKFSIYKMEWNDNIDASITDNNQSLNNTGDNLHSKAAKLIESITLPRLHLPVSEQQMILLDGQCIKQYNLFSDVVNDSKYNLNNFAMCVLFGGFGGKYKDERAFTCIPINFDNYVENHNNNIHDKSGSDDEEKQSKKSKKPMIDEKNIMARRKQSNWLHDATSSTEFRKLTSQDMVPYHCSFGGFTWDLIANRYIIVIGGVVQGSSKEAVSDYIWYFDLSNSELKQSNVRLPCEILEHSAVVDDENNCVHIIAGNRHWQVEFCDIIEDFPWYCKINWENERIIWIAYFKNNDNKKCFLNQMSKDVITYVISFLK